MRFSLLLKPHTLHGAPGTCCRHRFIQQQRSIGNVRLIDEVDSQDAVECTSRVKPDSNDSSPKQDPIKQQLLPQLIEDCLCSRPVSHHEPPASSPSGCLCLDFLANNPRLLVSSLDHRHSMLMEMTQHATRQQFKSTRVEQLRHGLPVNIQESLLLRLSNLDNNYPSNLIPSRRQNSQRPREELLHIVYQQLQEEAPLFLVKEPSYDIYAKGVLLDNELLRLRTRGLLLYKIQMRIMPLFIRVVWSGLTLEILKITRHTYDGTVRIRWQLRGKPRTNPLVVLLYGANSLKSEGYRTIDGFSLFFVDEQGLIDHHKIMKMMPSPLHQKPSRLLSVLALFRLPNRMQPSQQLQDRPVAQS